MKTLLNTLFVFVLFQGLGQTTSIPDQNFENALIDLGYDVFLDGSVQTANINSINSLDVSFYNISNLSGIQDFTSLSNLTCHSNNLTSLNVSGLSNLQIIQASNNQLSSLSTVNCTSLYEIHVYNNNLSTLNLSHLNNLIHLHCDQNNIMMLDLSNNPYVQTVNCSENNLICLNLKSGNYTIQNFWAISNPNLSCIEHHDPTWASANLTIIDAQTSFSSYCDNACTTGLSELNSADKELVMVVNLLGQETEISSNTPLIYIYSDGSTKKVFKAE